MSRRRKPLPPPSSWRRGGGTFFVAIDVVCSCNEVHLARLGLYTADDAPGEWWCEGFDPVERAPDGHGKVSLQCPRCGANPQWRAERVDEMLRAMWQPRRCHVETLTV